MGITEVRQEGPLRGLREILYPLINASGEADEREHGERVYTDTRQGLARIEHLSQGIFPTWH